MTTIHDLRAQHGRVFLTETDAGFVPWRPLPIGEYYKYDQDMQRGVISPAHLENEIFTKCVADNSWVINIDQLPAGIVSMVARNIMETSGPQSLAHFDDLLEQKRAIAGNVIHELMCLIIRVFSAYTPEDIYALDFDTFMLRVAQAEKSLLEAGLLKKPLRLDTEAPPPGKRRPPPDLRALWDSQNTTPKPAPRPVAKPPESGKINKSKVPGIFNEQGKVRVTRGLDHERVASEKAWGKIGHEELEEHTIRKQMIEDAHVIYKDVIDKLPYYKK